MSNNKEKEVAEDEAALRALLAHNLRINRIQRNISQHDLAERSGLHRNFISEVERGQRNVTLANLGKLANGVGVHAMELLRPIEESSNALPKELSPVHRSKRGGLEP